MASSHLKIAREDEWTPSSIGDQVQLQRGFDITKAVQRGGNVPVISSSGLSSHHDTAMAKGPGVILGRKGVVGSVHFVEEDYWPHDTTLWVKDFRGNEPRFVYYFFRAMARQLASMDVGSANPSLNRNHVHPLRVLWPCLQEQERISTMLASLDERIAVWNSTNGCLELIARTIFKSWFVNFDPVRAKADGREPEGMDTANAALFPKRWVESELGIIPDGWSVRTVADISDANARTMGRGYVHSKIDYVDISAVEPGRIIATKRYQRPEAPSRAKRLVVDGDVIWSCVRPNRRSYALILEPRESLVVSTGFVTLTATSVPFSFLYFSVTSDGFVDYLTMRADGAAYPAVRPETFQAAKLVVPSQGVVESFHRIAEPLLRKSKANSDQAQTLTELRDTLLPRLISGKLRVPEAEKLMEAVL